ncbi:Beta-lactamase domain protein [Elusimicrobium minutum Pei191]|uniref:Beta-lactamase domain protein n=1 Tax=Elusimicrobium minutum (strain Pei191) TaxID=445932 RepID=B2KBU7_ELUMP|nr:MBL fold metallo-hydrolase [Elusimicrobium minutum]ACC97851.1 Beta-lactamase domain protein [Elusimicrobium minutum Pei191]
MKNIIKIMFGVLFLAALPAFAAQDFLKYDIGSYKFYAMINNTGAISDVLIGNKDKITFDKYKAAGWNANAINYFLLDTGTQKILFDTGLPLARGGKVLERLEAIGVKPQDISIICLTHMHMDHIGGMLDDEGKKVFPNAKVFLSKEEAEYWNNPNNDSSSFKSAKKVLEVYGESIIKFPQKQKITDGVTSVPLFGHTPGHTGFIIENKGKKLVILGDVIHANIQFVNPDIYLTYDVDPKTAMKTRKLVLKKAAAEGVDITGMHIAPPSVGKIKKTGKGYLFERHI